MTLIDEINEQPESLERAIRENAGVFADVALAVSGCSHIVIAARGTSDNAARYAQYVWGIRNELSVSLTTPSLFSIYRRPPSLTGALVVGISQSGQSPDIVSVLEESRRQGRPTAAITNAPNSPLAAAADIVVPLNSGPELAVAATKTYTAQLAVIGAISEAITGGQPGVSDLPDLAAAALGADDEARTAAGLLAAVEHAAVLGRGFNLATAFEWALKMQELSYVVAQPFSTADFLHGPVAVVDKGYPVMAVVAEGPTAEDVQAAVGRAAERGAPTVLLTNTEVDNHQSVIRFPPAPEWLTPIPAIVAAQLFTYHLTVAQGNDPDSPRGLSKVTKTT